MQDKNNFEKIYFSKESIKESVKIWAEKNGSNMSAAEKVRANTANQTMLEIMHEKFGSVVDEN